MLRVRDRVADHVLEEHLQHTTGLLINQAGNALDTTTASESADGRLGDAFDVATEDLSVTHGAALAEAIATLAETGHFVDEEVGCANIISLPARWFLTYKQRSPPRVWVCETESNQGY